MFGATWAANLTNIVLENVSIIGGATSSRLGSLVGESSGGNTIGCRAEGEVLGQPGQIWIGGLLGLNHNPQVENCSFSGKIPAALWSGVLSDSTTL